MSNAFASLPQTARGHFLLSFYGAIHRLLCYVEYMAGLGGESLDDLSGRLPFLAHYRDEMRRFLPAGLAAADAPAWWDDELAAWTGDVPGHLPLAALAGAVGPGPDAAEAVAIFLLTGLVEEDSRFGTLLAHLQAPLPSRRLTLELAGQILGATSGRPHGFDIWEVCRPLLNAGVVEVVNRDAPRPEWMLRVAPPLWDAARDSLISAPGQYTLHAAADLAALEELILPDDFLQRLGHVPSLLAGGKARLLILRGMMGSERLEVAGAVARALGRGLIEVASPTLGAAERAAAPGDERFSAGLGPLCTLAQALPVLSFDLGPGETVALPPLAGYDGPVVVLVGAEGGFHGALAEQALTLALPLSDAALRLRQWQRALGDTPAERLEEIAARFLLPGGYVRQSAVMAVAQAALDGRQVVRPPDVRAATRALNRQLLDNLADRIETNGRWGDLVVNEHTGRRLRELERRCLFREQLLEHLGPAFGGANRGVRALFSGGSGTGKTLAARILAAELGMDLYRVDLASVINKYIGETEKNLHRVLSRAEELDVILLLDEGDSLLGNRTEVKSSNDRYANLETNYLLQRLEHYQGIVIVTSNAAQNIDNAFQRRMDVVVNFTPPLADERQAIWQLHLPAGHAVAGDDLGHVSARCALTGGQIRNAALSATLLALGDGAPVGDRHLIEAVQAEYRKAGAACPLEDTMRTNGTGATFDAFRRHLRG